jgi:hypothetical protein
MTAQIITTIAGLNEAMLRCRTLGHSWDDFTVLMRPPAFGERMSFRCTRCTTERHDICSWVDGSLIQREYRYPDAYHLDGKYARAEFRLALMHTLKPKRRKGRTA